MQVLFCRPEAPQQLDDGFELEADALDELGLPYAMIAMEDVVDGEFERALDGALLEEEVLYRGWMLTGEEYEQLAVAIGERGAQLVTSHDEYAAAHYLPSWFAAVASQSPATRWIEGDDLEEAWEAACELGAPPFVVKDHVKSVKEMWFEACFVPGGASKLEMQGVCASLVEARGERFERGIVVRRFVPLVYEHRMFFWRGRLIAEAPYHDVEAIERPARFANLASAVESPFFSADIALTDAGEWLVLELGDGGVSTLPPTMDPRAFYRALAEVA